MDSICGFGPQYGGSNPPRPFQNLFKEIIKFQTHGDK